ncbi:hypothetical protein GCM10022419_030280 [Nonomuraea rosea]|uniref:Uncharacterized protein n=1 Tax=Nonomuraea rosea TaxID=638574 RepID=A0ABP6W7X1_9ACTN
MAAPMGRAPPRISYAIRSAVSRVSLKTLAATSVFDAVTPAMPTGISTRAATAVAIKVTRPRRDLVHRAPTP